MSCERLSLWEEHPEATLEIYRPASAATDACVVILPGGGYVMLAPHEGRSYAEWFQERGMTAIVCAYRTAPNHFPDQLLDAREAVRYVRMHADTLGLSPDKVLIMGSSAGGHLAALTSTYMERLPGEIHTDVCARPNAQILCYPVIHLVSKRLGAHTGSGENLLGDKVLESGEALTPAYFVDSQTPPCFLFHTFEDATVPVIGSLDYMHALWEHGVACEAHLFPHGHHGLGLCTEDTPAIQHASQWSSLLESWLRYMGYLPS